MPRPSNPTFCPQADSGVSAADVAAAALQAHLSAEPPVRVVCFSRRSPQPLQRVLVIWADEGKAPRAVAEALAAESADQSTFFGGGLGGGRLRW